MKSMLTAGVVFLMVGSVEAKLVTQAVEYKAGDVTLVGYLAYDDAVEGRRPGVLIFPEWWGVNDYAKRRAEQVARLGYVAFAADMYGQGRATTDARQAGAWAGEVRGGPAWRERARAAFEILVGHERVDARHIAAIGYCFGGATALQLAYSEPRLAGVVSFHGALPAPRREDYANIKAPILVLHGAGDPLVSREEVDTFLKALNEAKADWQMISYSGAVHSFTNPNSGRAGIKGVAYNKKADERSWAHMRVFFREIFGEGRGRSTD